MPVDRQLWGQHLTKWHAPSWPCPSCASGRLRLSGAPIGVESTPASRGEHQYDYEGWFSCILKCFACEQPVAVVGSGFYEEVPDEDGQPGWSEYLVPRFVHPTIDIFRVPRECPKLVAAELRDAFKLFWCDPRAAANRSRSATESLLDHLKIKRKARHAGGSFRRLSLHQRLELLKKKNSDVGDQLLAVKWLGNAGSHMDAASKGDVTKADLLDGFEILEHVIEEVFKQRSTRIRKLAGAINRRRGPRSARAGTRRR